MKEVQGLVSILKSGSLRVKPGGSTAATANGFTSLRPSRSSPSSTTWPVDGSNPTGRRPGRTDSDACPGSGVPGWHPDPANAWVYRDLDEALAQQQALRERGHVVSVIAVA